jgi:hypothetical protein
VRNMQPCSGSPHVQLFCDDNKVAEMSQFHCLTGGIGTF